MRRRYCARPGSGTRPRGCRRGRRASAQLGKVALGDQATVGEDADTLRHALGDYEDVGRHDDGAAGANARLQHVLT